MISIIICSIDKERFRAIVAHYTRLMGTEPFEIVGVHDARSMCDGYNRGFAASRGDVVIFSHDDIEFMTDALVPRLKELLSTYHVVGLAGTTLLSGPGWATSGPPFIVGMVTHSSGPHFSTSLYGAPRRVVPNVQAMDGLFIACRREVAQRIAWDAETFNGFHCYDVDWTYRAFRAGFKLAVTLDLPVLHQSTATFEESWKPFAQAFMNKHAATLTPLPHRNFRFASIIVATRQDTLLLYQSLLSLF